MLENLRKKSEGERRSIALMLAAVVTTIIFLIWLSVFLSNRSLTLEENVENNNNENTDVATSLSTLKEEFTNFFEDASTQFEENQEVFQEENLF